MADKIIYYVSTGLLSLVMCFSAYNYFFNYEMISGFFEAFNYPTYIIYPLAIAKLLALVAIWTRISPMLKEWAYAGLFFDVVLAWVAHYMANDGGGMFAIIAFVALVFSYIFGRRVFGSPFN